MWWKRLVLNPILGQEGLEPSIKLAPAVCTDDVYFITCGHDALVDGVPWGLRSIGLESEKRNEFESGEVVDAQQDESSSSEGVAAERA